MRRPNKNRNSILLLVYLPVESDYNNYESEPWLQFLHKQAANHKLLFIDLIAEFRKLQPQTIEHMFNRKSGHYTEEGNSYIAKVLYDMLGAIPEISDKIRQK